VAEADQLAVDAPVAPAGTLLGHPYHQRPEGWCDGWSAGVSSRVGPAPGDELGVPAQQGSGETSRSRRRSTGRSRLSARSTQLSLTRAWCRRSTATS
jgi:hypothetical protein